MRLLSELLPLKGKKASDWLFNFLKADVLPDGAIILNDDDLQAQRERNERLASYLPTLTTALYAYRQALDVKRAEFIRDNPKPEKGVTEWRESFDLENTELRNVAEMLADLIDTIKTRVSVTQSNLKSHSREG